MAYAPDNIVISLLLQNLPAVEAAFQTVLHLVDQAQGTGNDLGGDRYRTYLNASQVAADRTGTVLSAETLLAAQDFFSQPGQNKTLLIGRVDTVGVEGYDDGLAACIVAGANFWLCTADTRVAADQVLIATYLESTRTWGFYIFQSADADWLTASIPAAFSTIETFERWAVVYHDIATEWADVCWAGNRMDFDPDNQSVPWFCSLSSVAAYTTALTAGELTNAEDNNVNVIGVYGTATRYLDKGETGVGRSVDYILASDWYTSRSETDIITFHLAKTARGEKIPVNPQGQNMILGLLRKRLRQGIDAGHFETVSPVDDTVETEAVALAITAADVAAQRLRFNVQLVWQTAARAFTVNVYGRAT